jgi:uncharacterized protein (DUF488 family)
LTAADQLARLRAAAEAGAAQQRPEHPAEPYPISGGLRRRHDLVADLVTEIAGKTVWTLGHQRMPWGVFLRTLQQFGVSLVVDVRHTPWPKAVQFGEERLRDELKLEGIGYRRWPALCGRSQRAQGYERELVNLLDHVASERAVVLLCVEEDPRRCHRWTIIGADLKGLGVNVKNIRSRMAY